MRDALDTELASMSRVSGRTRFSESSIKYGTRNGHPSATAIEQHPIGQKAMWVYATVVHRDDGSIVTLSGTRETESDAIAAEASFSSREAVPTPAVEPVEPTLQRDKKTQAIEQAKSYLELGGASKKGLVGLLKSDGFSRADAEFAVKYLDLDWDAEAVRAAQECLRHERYSKKSLIETLTGYYGFTLSQAKAGARGVGY